MAESPPTYTIKLIGTAGCGKSSVNNYFINNSINNNNRIKLTVSHRDCFVNLVEVNYSKSEDTQVNKCDGYILLYDTTSSKSFYKVPELKKYLQTELHNKPPPVFLVGSKADLKEKREVQTDKAQKLALSLGWSFIEISTKTGLNIDKLFSDLVNLIRAQDSFRNFNFKKPKSNAHSPNDFHKMRLKKGDSILNVLTFFEQSKSKAAAWETPTPSKREWSNVEAITIDDSLINTKCKSKGYTIETGRNDIPYEKPQGKELNGNNNNTASSNLPSKDALASLGLDASLLALATANQDDTLLEQQEQTVAYLQERILSKEHIHFVGEVDGLGAVVISMTAYSQGRRTKAIVHTKFGSDRMYIPVQYNNEKDMVKYVLHNHRKLADAKEKDQIKQKFLPVGSQSESQKLLDRDLINIENMQIALYLKAKIGVLYVKDGQTEENQMFSNVDTSPEFEEFLNFLGDRIALKGWNHYTGGLDTKANSTGTHSVYTKFEGVEIMFHVCTMLPFQTEDLQRVERKRHLGNDVVVIIFKEGNQPFDPLTLTSQFNHVFIVVQVQAKNEYKISIANKPGVQLYGPFLKHPAVYAKNLTLRNLLLAKVINGERGSMQSPEFKGKFTSTRRLQLEEILKKYYNAAKNPANNPKKSTPLKSSPSEATQESISSFLSKDTLDKDIENIVSVGKSLYTFSIQSVRDFDTYAFKDLLQQLLFWSVSNVNTYSKLQQNSIIESAKNVVKVGRTLSEAYENRKHNLSDVDDEKCTQVQDQLKRALTDFFMSLKAASSTDAPSGNMANEKNFAYWEARRKSIAHRRSASELSIPQFYNNIGSSSSPAITEYVDNGEQSKTSYDTKAQPPIALAALPKHQRHSVDSTVNSHPKPHKEELQTPRLSSAAIAELMKHAVDHFKLVRAKLDEEPFNAGDFFEVLSEMGMSVKEVAQALDDVPSKRLAQSLKGMLQKAMLFKHASSELRETYKDQLADSFAELIATFRSTTSAIPLA